MEEEISEGEVTTPPCRDHVTIIRRGRGRCAPALPVMIDAYPRKGGDIRADSVGVLLDRVESAVQQAGQREVVGG